MIDASSRAAMRASDVVVATSLDYASSSRVYSSMSGKVIAIPPPFQLRTGGSPVFRRSDGPHIGAMGRIVEEKGFDYLIRAFRMIEDPAARLLIAGDYTSIAGLSVIDRLRTLAGDDERITFLGFVEESAVSDFFASLDVFAFPSINPLEAFGISQLEALSAGLPVVASDLPGVRLPVLRSGRGRLVPPRDVEALAAALLDPRPTDSGMSELEQTFSESAEDQYLTLICELAGSPWTGDALDIATSASRSCCD
jgi:glycosyltransferase involved in cell wall biosynthesis